MDDVSKKTTKGNSKTVEGLGLRIAQERIKFDLSQSIMADLVGMSRPNYTAIENSVSGRFLKDYQLKSICQKLNVSSDYLLGLISDPNPNADMMAIIKYLGISSESIQFIHSLNSEYKSNNLCMFDDFIKSLDSNLLDLIFLYKKVKMFLDTEYSFVLEFTKDIKPGELTILNTSLDLDTFKSDCKYFYYNLDDARNFFKSGRPIFNNPNYEVNEAFDKVMTLLESSKYTESYMHIYDDISKQHEFKLALEKIKKILKSLIMILDFDETGLIFATYDKEEEINKYIDQIISIIDTSSKDAIDNEIENLYSCLL